MMKEEGKEWRPFSFSQKASLELEIHSHMNKKMCVTREEMNSPGCALGVL